MYETIAPIAAGVFIFSCFALFFFCAIKPSVRIARWFYLLFGISVIVVTPKVMESVEEKWLVIWPGLFAFVGIAMFFSMSKGLKNATPEEEKQMNEKLHEASIKGGKRRMAKEILKK